MLQYKSIVDTLAQRVAERGVPATSIYVNVPTGDDDLEGEVESLGYAEGQSFIIEYIDSAGRASTRRITVFEIVQGYNGIPSLIARCHERKATRQFRVDRIRICIDFDGQVHENVPQFLSENFGMSIGLARRVEGEAGDRWVRIRNIIKTDAVVLAALSHSDGYVHALEMQGIEQHLAQDVERTGLILKDDEVASIFRYVERLRPSARAIEIAIEDVSRRNPKEVMRLLRACIAVIDADGKRHPAEMTMFDSFCFELTGVHLPQ